MARQIRDAMNHMRSPLIGVRQSALPSLIKRIQHFSITIANTATSNTATITSVDTTNSLIFFNGSFTDNASYQNEDAFARVALTNATTVTATRTGADGNCFVTGCVIEFVPGVISNVQRGTITVAAASASNTATITALSTENMAFCNFLGNTSSQAADSALNAFCKTEMTNSTTVQASRTGTTGDCVVGYQACEFSSLVINKTYRANGAISAAYGAVTIDKMYAGSATAVANGGAIFAANGGFKSNGAASAQNIFTLFMPNACEKATNIAMPGVKDSGATGTGGSYNLPVVFFLKQFIKNSQVVVLKDAGAGIASYNLPAEYNASKVSITRLGEYSNDTTINNSPSLSNLYFDGTTITADRAGTSNNLSTGFLLTEWV